jgi:hypothetical protein
MTKNMKAQFMEEMYAIKPHLRCGGSLPMRFIEVFIGTGKSPAKRAMWEQ